LTAWRNNPEKDRCLTKARRGYSFRDHFSLKVISVPEVGPRSSKGRLLRPKKRIGESSDEEAGLPLMEFSDFAYSSSDELPDASDFEDSSKSKRRKTQASAAALDDESDGSSSDESSSEDDQDWTRDCAFIPPKPFVPPDFFVNPDFGLDEGSSRLDLFDLYFSEPILDEICLATSEKALSLGRDIVVSPDILRSWIGAAILMGVFHFPTIPDYFRKELDFTPITAFWTRDSFLAIYECLKLPELNEDDYPRRFKIQWLFDMFNEVSISLVAVPEHISVDDCLMHNKSRNIMKQYDMKKPARWGFLMYKLADPETGFTFFISLYPGKGLAVRVPGLGDFLIEHHFLNCVSDSGGSIVYRILEQCDLLGHRHKLYIDSHLNSVPLVEKLLEEDIYLCGTFAMNRKFVPRALASKSAIKALSLEPGVFGQFSSLFFIITFSQPRSIVCPTCLTVGCHCRVDAEDWHACDMLRLAGQNEGGSSDRHYI
jgi:hypothetical protein